MEHCKQNITKAQDLILKKAEGSAWKHERKGSNSGEEQHRENVEQTQIFVLGPLPLNDVFGCCPCV